MGAIGKDAHGAPPRCYVRRLGVSAAACRALADAQLDVLARAYAKMKRGQRIIAKPIRLADVAAAAEVPPAKLRSSKRTLAQIQRRAADFAQEYPLARPPLRIEHCSIPKVRTRADCMAVSLGDPITEKHHDEQRARSGL